MNQRLLTVLAFALVIAGITSFGLYQLILSHVQPAQVEKPVGTTKIVAATHNLEVGSLLRDTDLHEVLMSGPVPETAVHSASEIIGRGVIAAIYRDEPILSTRLAPKGAGAGLAAMIPVGMRAVALPVNEVVGLAGFVSPGMRVDVLISGVGSLGGGSVGTICRTILQNIEVLSAGQKVERNIEGKPESAQVVNLLVTPSQAETVNLASANTKVQLVLRNPLDTKDSSTSGTTLTKLMGNTEPPAPRPVVAYASPEPHLIEQPLKQPDMDTIEVFSGTQRSEQRFEARKK